MLLTTCPNCSAQFKVQPEQLNVRQGRVMCGRCRGVFNAFQSLTRVSDSEIAAETAETHATPQPLELPADLTDAIFLREEPLPLSDDFTQTDFPSDVRPTAALPPSLNLAALDDLDDAPARADAQEIAPQPSTSLLPYEESNVEAETANPLLAPVAGYRQTTRTARTGLWATCAVMLLLGLTAQLAYAFRSAVVQSFPQARPVYVTACEWTGCKLSWGRDDSAIRIEASDLIELPGKTGRILLTATLVNRSSIRQDLPALELKLTDNANQVILSRVLLPNDYLGRAPAQDENLAPNVELYVNLSFELTPRAQASGYGVRAFYY